MADDNEGEGLEQMTNEIEKPKYQEIIHDGKEARLYPNGVIRNLKGHIVYMPANVAHEISTQRRIRGEERAQRGIMFATQSESPDEAVEKIIKARVHVAMTDMGRAGNDAAKFVLERAGYVSSTKVVEVTGRVNHVPMPSPEFMKRREARAIDAEVVEDEDDS